MSDSVPPHRRQPTRLLHPWDSPGKNTGVGCHLLLQCMKVKSESEVAQSSPTLSDPMDCSLPGSSVHGIFPGKSTGVGCHCLLHRRVATSSNYWLFCHYLKHRQERLYAVSVKWKKLTTEFLSAHARKNIANILLPHLIGSSD